MCCQESGEREASVSLFCPKAKPGERKFRKVIGKKFMQKMTLPQKVRIRERDYVRTKLRV